MELYNAPATWFCVLILMQVFKMKSKDAAEQGFTFLSKNNAILQWNGSVLNLSQIIKCVVSSASEA